MGLTDWLKGLAEKVDSELEREERENRKRTTAAKKGRTKASPKTSSSKAKASTKKSSRATSRVKRAEVKQTRANGTWIGGVRSSHIPGFCIVKKFDPIRVAPTSIPPLFSTVRELDAFVKNLCGSPEDVREELEKGAKKLGANGFVNFHWIKRRNSCIVNSYEHKLSFDASYDPCDDDICLRDGKPYRILKDVAYNVDVFDGTATPVIFEPIRSDMSPQNSHSPKSQTISVKRKQIAIQERIDWPTYCVIDGSNIIREHGGTVEGLSACYFAVKNAGCHPQVFLDANIFHVLKEGNADKDRVLLDMLIKNHPEDFRKVPAGARADDFILQSADSNDGHVVSNDRYQSYANRYPWIVEDHRLHKFMFVNGHLMIPDFGVDVLVEGHDGNINKGSHVSIMKQPRLRNGQQKGKNGVTQSTSEVRVSATLLERVINAYDWKGSNIKKFLRTKIKCYGSIFGRFSTPDDVREISSDDILEILQYGFSHQEEYDSTFAEFCKMICRYHYEEYCTQCKELKIVRDAINDASSGI